jgi:hypothetical protein
MTWLLVTRRPLGPGTLLRAPEIRIAQFTFQVIGKCSRKFLMQCSNRCKHTHSSVRGTQTLGAGVNPWRELPEIAGWRYTH